MKSPYDFGAVGNGLADDTWPIQKWLDAIAGGAGYGAPGVFGLSNTVSIWSDTTIMGAGAGSFVLAKLPTFPADAIMVRNHVFAFPPAPPQDKNIAIYGTCFKGLPVQATDKDMVAFVGIANLVIHGCLFTTNRLKLLAGSNIVGAAIDNCEFTDFGKTIPVPEPGKCLFEGGPAIWFGWADSGISLTNNRIHDGHWAGILLAAQDCTVTGNRIANVCEAGIYGMPTNSTISGNRISGIKRKDCSAQGIELDTGASNVIISGNVVSNTEYSSIAMTNPQQVTVSGNVCDSPGQDGGASPQSSCIAVYNGGTGTAPRQVTIAGNILASDGAHYGISLNDNGGLPMNNMSVIGNNLGLAVDWKSAPIQVSPRAKGINYLERDNNY